jgi:hypothetical protein
LPFPPLLGLPSPTSFSTSSNHLNPNGPHVFLPSSFSRKSLVTSSKIAWITWKGKRPLGRSSCRRKNNIKTDVQEVR